MINLHPALVPLVALLDEFFTVLFVLQLPAHTFFLWLRAIFARAAVSSEYLNAFFF